MIFYRFRFESIGSAELSFMNDMEIGQRATGCANTKSTSLQLHQGLVPNNELIGVYYYASFIEATAHNYESADA